MFIVFDAVTLLVGNCKVKVNFRAPLGAHRSWASRKTRFGTTIAKVRYRKDPHMQNSMRKLKLTLTLTDTGGTVLTLMLGYRSL